MAQDKPAHTLDAFHRGDFWLVQPKGTGHRAGVDAMILAAAVPSAFVGRLADFGAGAGAAGLAVASRCRKATAVLVENAAEMAHFRSADARPSEERASPGTRLGARRRRQR